ncbi:hypothetical protein [Candidatus Poriferisodalis sp.]|uniref:hypothetical protein n=1 Tax=Candidatus Poriferisodalis sp. TaxID=3101277 RepID=UPI003B0149A3
MRAGGTDAVWAAAAILTAAIIVAGCADAATGEDFPVQTAESTTATAPLATAPLAEFLGGSGFEPGDDAADARVCGYLIIEDPYIHVLVTETIGESAPDSSIEPGLSRDDDGNLIYSWINLPRSGTRYDPQTRSLWVWDVGPMTDGDHVSVGGYGSFAHTDKTGDAYNVHQRNPWYANTMSPAKRPC